MPTSLITRLSIVGGAMLLTGCLVGPDYARPAVDMPVEFQGTRQEGESIANLPWWELFEDPQLDELVRLALAENRDLRAAVARVEEARAQLGVTRSDQFPSVDGAATGQRGNVFNQVLPGAGIRETFFLGVSASYEADLWGKYRRLSESARADLLATEDSQRTVLISLVADVASTYLLLRDLDARVLIAADTLEARKKSTSLIQARFDKGTVALLDVNQAEIQEATAAAQLASLSRQVRQAENLLNVLIGRNPRPIIRGRDIYANIIAPDVPTGLPSTLLERRPDIRAAEQRLAAQTARIGAAQALRIPSVSLTGSMGLASNDRSDLLESDAKIWGVGVDILGPIFDAGKRKSQVKVERARTEQALNEYEQTILRALQEVEDALAGAYWYREEQKARDFQVRAAQSASELSWARYNGGVTSYLEVLESDRSLFDAQLAASQVRRLWLVSIVNLYRALGGGWLPTEGLVPAPQASPVSDPAAQQATGSGDESIAVK